MVSVPTLVEQLGSLGVVRGGVLLVHTSFRAVRPVEGGPRGLIAALVQALGPDGTLVMPSWPEDADALFEPGSTEPARDLGVVARAFWRLPGVRRSPHVQAFAARGPRAEDVLRDPLPLPPHRPESPVGRVHELDGQVLLLGVDHDADTTIHLAEITAQVPYGITKTCTAIVDGRPTRVEYRENDHCCERFELVDGWLRETGAQVEGPVGNARARLCKSRDVVRAVVPRLDREPLLFLHESSAGCHECDAARASVVEQG
jgi:aminoglycoside N3'-acetyltransferase